MSRNNTISQNDGNQTQYQLEQEQHSHRPYNVHSSSSSPTSAKNNTTSSLLESQFLSTHSQQSLFSMDGTHGHFNITADVGASEFLLDQSFDETFIYVPQQQTMLYDMPYTTTDFQPSAMVSPFNGHPTRFHQRIDAYNNNNQSSAPQPSLQPNATQLRRKRKADDDDFVSGSVRIKKEHLDSMYIAPDSSQDTNADPCNYFPEEKLKLSVDASFQFPEFFVPDKSYLLPYVGQMLMVGLVDDKVNDDIRTLITKYRVGAIILSSRNMKGLYFFFFFFFFFDVALSNTIRSLVLTFTILFLW
jgi:hypothetical protein